VQYQKLERSGIRQYFDAVVISEEVGYLKPHPEIFRIALEQTAGITAADDPQAWKALKEETLMVGDDARNDIEGAQIFGIDQWFVKKNAASYGVGATYESDDLGLLFQ
jgi:FMN phosphatase YigB (HAD superfamily)